MEWRGVDGQILSYACMSSSFDCSLYTDFVDGQLSYFQVYLILAQAVRGSAADRQALCKVTLEIHHHLFALYQSHQSSNIMTKTQLQ